MAKLLLDPDGSSIKYEGKEIYSCDYMGSIKAVDIEKRKLVMVGTDESVDRDGDIIRLSGWRMENYRKNPVFLWAHNYGSVPLARAERVIKRQNPSRMEFQLVFPTKTIYPFADMILELYGEKIINTSSVGFIPSKWESHSDEEKEKNPYGRVYTSQELLELSGCAVPSNPNALQNALKGKNFGFKQDELLGYLSGATLIPRPENEDDVLDEIEKSETEIVDETTIQVQVTEQLEVEEGSYGATASPSPGISERDTVDPPVTTTESVEGTVTVSVEVTAAEAVAAAIDEEIVPSTSIAPSESIEELMAEDLEENLINIMSRLDSIEQTLGSLANGVKDVQTTLTKVLEEGQRRSGMESDPASLILRDGFNRGKTPPEPPTKVTNLQPVQSRYKNESILELKRVVSDFSKAVSSIKLS